MSFYTLTFLDYYFNAQVAIWQIDLLNYSASDSPLLNSLTPEELERIAHFRKNADKARFAAVRIALRELLAEILDIPPTRVSISSNQYGKPYLTDSSTCKFNVSHSGNVGLIAISHTCEVGVDIEQIRPLADLNVAHYVFSNEELEFFQKLDADSKRDFFFKSWVKKESVLKALGMGFSKWSPNQLSILSKTDIVFEEKQIQTCEIPLTSEYAGAVSMF